MTFLEAAASVSDPFNTAHWYLGNGVSFILALLGAIRVVTWEYNSLREQLHSMQRKRKNKRRSTLRLIDGRLDSVE